MCRLLWARAKTPFDLTPFLEQFADVARNSSEYQGHGWGCAWIQHGTWKTYRNILPVWEDNLSEFSQTTRLPLVAR